MPIGMEESAVGRGDQYRVSQLVGKESECSATDVAVLAAVLTAFQLGAVAVRNFFIAQ